MSREALLAAKQALIQDQVRKRIEDATPPPPTSRRGVRLAMAAIALALAALLGVRPAWLFPRPPTESPALQEASLRVRIYIETELVERYRQNEGRLPATLLESGGDTTGLKYAQDGRSYTITGKNGGIELTYRSTVPATEFLGNSYDLIKARSAR
jgi:hypothetical protein